MDDKLKRTSVTVFTIVLMGGAIALGYRLWPPPQAPLGVSYPYACKDCGAVFDVNELRKPGMWRIAPGGGSDSVVLCIVCNQGWAYPVTQCPMCGTKYLLHLLPREIRCPKCYPEVADAAAKAGIDLVLGHPTSRSAN